MYTAHLPTTFSSKHQTASRLYLQESSGVYISKRELHRSWGNYKQAFPLKNCQRVAPLSAVFICATVEATQHLSLIYLIMVMTKVCLPASGGGGGGEEKNTCQVFILCNQEESLQRITDVLKWQWSLQRAGGRRLGKNTRPTSLPSSSGLK